jgi:single-strand DNA-binding protein
VNYLIIAGHLGAVTTLRVATHARRGNADETIWWRVTIWGEQFDKMIPYFKKGSPIIVFGDIQKPEIFTDREGKQQISLNLTANHIQFSPFGKPERTSQEGSSYTASPSGISSPFNAMHEGSSPYAPGGSQTGQIAPAMQDCTFDEDPPF